MEFKTQLKEIASKINVDIASHIEKEEKRTKDISTEISDIFGRVYEMCVDGGKRLRGALVYYSFLMYGGKNLKEILRIAASIELTHFYLLVHDDSMDQAGLRRGYPTVHEIYKKIYLEKYNGGRHALHFGESMATNIGDVFNHMSTKIFLEAKFPPELIVKALHKAHFNFNNVGYGQILDVYSEIADVDEEYVIQVHLFKTGYYTYETPLHIGAILAGANKKDLDTLSDYALPGGISFQIVDDLIDLFSTKEQTGKKIGTDIKEGKKTLLTVKAYENATKSQIKVLDEVLGKREATIKEIEQVKKIIIETGSVEYSRKEARKLLIKSTNALSKAKKGINPEGKKFLQDLNDYMIHRIDNEENNKLWSN